MQPNRATDLACESQQRQLVRPLDRSCSIGSHIAGWQHHYFWTQTGEPENASKFSGTGH